MSKKKVLARYKCLLKLAPTILKFPEARSWPPAEAPPDENRPLYVVFKEIARPIFTC